MNRTIPVALAIALAGATASAAAAADAAPSGRGYARVAYRLYAPTPWRADMRDYRFSRDGGGYEQEYRLGNCHVKRALEDDGDFTEEVHCEAPAD